MAASKAQKRARLSPVGRRRVPPNGCLCETSGCLNWSPHCPEDGDQVRLDGDELSRADTGGPWVQCRDER